jgi:aldehyde:ferredoxin oxidoreductase
MNFGYAGNLLKVDLSTGRVGMIPTETYADRFLGGRGVGAKLYWDELVPEIGALDPENPLIFVTGPVCGVPGFAGSRWKVMGKSPIDNRFSYANLGGSWGACLKFAGFDGLIIKGKADRPVYLAIDGGNAEIREATDLTGKGAIQTGKALKQKLGKNTRILAIGPAGENLVTFATILADEDATGSWGFGAVMGSKNLKAIAVSGHEKVKLADPNRVVKLRRLVHKLNKSNFQWDGHLAALNNPRKSLCHGCISGCWRTYYKLKNGDRAKYMCQPSDYYTQLAEAYYGKATETPMKACHLANEYGLDTRVLQSIVRWLIRCHESGVAAQADSELLLSKIGSIEFIENLIRMISLRKGLGHILAEGPYKAAKRLKMDSDDLVAGVFMKSGDIGNYDPRIYITNGLFYAMEPRTPIGMLHEICWPVIMWSLTKMGVPNVNMTTERIRILGERYWGSEAAADFATLEGKALAAVKIQDRQYAIESLILCSFTWPLWLCSGYESIVNHSDAKDLDVRIFNAITGNDIDQAELYTISNRIINMQRAILVKEGRKGRVDDSIEEYNYTVPFEGEHFNPDGIVPGRGDEIVSRKGAVVDRKEFRKLKDEYYRIRGWDVATGLQKKSNLEELDLADISEALETYGLLAGTDDKTQSPNSDV